VGLFARRDRPTVAQPVRAKKVTCVCPPEHHHREPGPCQYTEEVTPNSDALVWGCPCRGAEL
jgi:hypothetical protein